MTWFKPKTFSANCRCKRLLSFDISWGKHPEHPEFIECIGCGQVLAIRLDITGTGYDGYEVHNSLTLETLNREQRILKV